MRATSFFSLCITTGCIGMSGLRPSTAAERGAPADARFVCLAGPSVDGTKVSEVVPNPPNEQRLIKTDEGLRLIEDVLGTTSTTTNHWRSPRGDHFFVWGSSTAGETIVSPDRSFAVGYIYGHQPADPDSYRAVRAPDDTMRPDGLPLAATTCLPTETARKRAAAGEPLLPRTGLRPVSSEAVGEKFELRQIACQRPGQKPATSARVALNGVNWAWMPTGIFFTSTRKRYLTFTLGRIGAPFLLYEIEPDPSSPCGPFEVKFGEATLRGTILDCPALLSGSSSTGALGGAVIQGTLAGRAPGELECSYTFR